MSEDKVANSSIYEKIENKGSLDAKEILRIGQEKAKALEENILNDAKKEVEQLLKKVYETNANIIKTKTTEFEQAARQRSLLKKKEVIDQVFLSTISQLNQISDEKLVEMVVRMINKELIKGDEVIKVSKNDFQRYLKLFSTGKDFDNLILLDKLNQLLNNPKYNLKLSKEYADINGGFIIIGNNFDIDLSYQTILDNLKEKYETKIASMLFDGELE